MFAKLVSVQGPTPTAMADYDDGSSGPLQVLLALVDRPLGEGTTVLPHFYATTPWSFIQIQWAQQQSMAGLQG